MDVQSDQEIYALFNPLFDEFSVRLDAGPLPLLAHYTSITAMEKILRDNQLWFSNPLFMNDLQEMRFGMNHGSMRLRLPSLLLNAAETQPRATILGQAVASYFQSFDDNEAFDTYVFCASEHDPGNSDGLLSMWRGYGHHGNGAALVFDASKITPVPESPLIAAKVVYGSDGERFDMLRELIGRWIDTTKKASLPDDKLFLAAHAGFALIKTFALTTKHIGFSEEKEWRAVSRGRPNQLDGVQPPRGGRHAR